VITRGLLILAAIAAAMVFAPSIALAAPAATTYSATDITATSATLNGVADPVDPDSAYQFQYGTTTGYGSYTQASAMGAGQRAVAATVTGLTPGTVYHFRLIVLQGSYAPAMSPGGDVTFTTPEQPPVLVGAGPAISGTAQQGQTLTETHGIWSNSPTGYIIQWYDCASQGSPCAPIFGATGITYTLGVADVGATIRVAEVATNAGGASALAGSQATALVVPLPPSATAPDPSISGVTTQGQTLTESHGGWSTAPTNYLYQWADCNAAGAACAAIAGATGQTYTLGATDVGSTIRVFEEAVNTGGNSAPRSSAATGVVQALPPPSTPSTPPTPPAAPSNSIPPTVTGAVMLGRPLSATTGAWSGTTPMTFAYQWQRCAAACTDISGATGTTYSPTRPDIGARIGVLVTATDTVGSTAASASPVGPVAATSPITTAARVSLAPLLDTPTSTAGLLRSYGETLRFTAPQAGRLEIVWYARSKHHRVTVAHGTVVFERAQRGTVSVALTRSGAKLLSTHKRVRITSVATFTPVGGTSVKMSRSFTL
jgi:hypothetical protein